MNKILLTKPIAMLTIGYPGAGKTNFSRNLAERMRLPHVSAERIRFELFENPSLSKEENEIVERIFNYSCELVLKSGQSLICDGDFSTLASRKRFAKLLSEHGYQPLLVWVQTDMDTAFERASKRNRRRTDDQYVASINLEEFDRQQKQFKRPDTKENYIVVSGKHAFKSQFKTLLRKLSMMGALDGTSIASLQASKKATK